jgi:CPA2 family monovalent cation:H+ antiporter-2
VAHADWLNDILIFLVAAGIIVPFFQRARMGAVLGFLVVGALVGPYGLRKLADSYPWLRFLTIEDPVRVEPFAELGVIFLLFLIGLELNRRRLWELRRYVLGVGAVQVALSALAIGLAAAATGAGRSAAIVLGLCLALSSTAIVMQLLVEQRRAATRAGRVALSVLLFQDLMVVPIMFATGLLGRGSDSIALALASAVAQAIAVVLLIMLVGRFVLRPLLRFTAKTGSRDFIMAITLLILIVAAGATGMAGLSAALGAFLAGLLLSETEFRHHIEVDLEPFKGLLLGLFFMTVGMSVDLSLVAAQAGWILVAVLGLILIKTAILFAANRAFGLAVGISAEVALLLAQAGEFAFVVIGVARANGLMPAETASFAFAVAGLSLMVTPILARIARRASGRLSVVDHAAHLPDADAAELEDHVVIGGFGRVGQTVARLLEAEDVAFVALDTNGALVSEQRKRGYLVYFGDASRRELLERAGAARARAFVVTLDAPGASERMIEAVKALKPGAPIFARARDSDHAARLAALGAHGVIPEAVEASLQLAGRLLETLGLPEDAVAQRLEAAREEELGRQRAGAG